jgi:exopolyphosphatase/guanosine-5'-triphosphate,3'-diphosphate pyrophosphatase
MSRAHEALARCAARLKHYPLAQVRAVATEACRAAENGPAFLRDVTDRTGLNFITIPAAEEAALSALGCADLIVPGAEVALVVDVGGGSTEFTWVDAVAARAAVRTGAIEPAILAWMSLPIGVVTLAEAAQGGEDLPGLRGIVRRAIQAAPEATAMAHLFERRPGMLIGASGAVTSLAGVALGLTRYSRARVDGIWLSAAEFATVAHTVQTMTQVARFAHPCIGPDRADLVGPGAAIMQAVLEVWPFTRLRVADRGLREGLLTKMIAETRVAT